MSYATKRFMVIFCPSMSIAKTSQSRLLFFIYFFYNRKPLKIFKDYIFSIICCKKKSKKKKKQTLHYMKIKRQIIKLTLTKLGQQRTCALLLRTSTTASRIPGSRLMAFSTEPAHTEHVIPMTENKAFKASDPSPSTLFSFCDICASFLIGCF